VAWLTFLRSVRRRRGGRLEHIPEAATGATQRAPGIGPVL